jgi:DNA-directed RNA polymerase subunit RPC12/RpoP
MIHFRCIRCQHTVDVSEKMIGQRIYCPVCYFTLTVPSASTVNSVDESQLYTADSVPVDVREMENRKLFVSLPCPVCSTNIAVTKEQIGMEISCPECETKVRVPESIEEKVNRSLDEWARDNRMWDKRTPEERARDGLMWDEQQITPNQSDKETYALRDHNNSIPEYQTIRVYCKLCGTMMYASDSQIGTELTCPDCETKTVVPTRSKPVPLPPPLPSTFEGGTTFGLAGTIPPPVTGSLIPVVCSLCGTRMYAGESEIGGYKTCPDCGRQTEIKAVPKSEQIQPVISPNGGYGVNQSELQEKRPVFRTLTDYRRVEGSLDKELYDRKEPNPPNRNFPQPPTPPVLYNPDHPSFPEPNLNPNLKPNLKPNLESDFESDLEPDIDAEMLRERRTAKQSDSENRRDIIKMVQRTPLPKYPFLNRILVPFANAGLWGRTIIATLLCVAGVFIGTQLPAILGLATLFVVLSAPFGVIILILGLTLLANTGYSLFLWTTVGNDLPEKEDWLEYRLLESGSFVVWLVLITILAASPGYLLLSHVAVSPEWMSELSVGSALVSVLLLLGSFILFFPVFFLSSMESGSYFIVLSKETGRSLINHTGVWLRFYIISFLLFALFCLIILIISLLIHRLLIGISLLIPVWAFFSLLYARFLGRLGWTLEESARQL